MRFPNDLNADYTAVRLLEGINFLCRRKKANGSCTRALYTNHEIALSPQSILRLVVVISLVRRTARRKCKKTWKTRKGAVLQWRSLGTCHATRGWSQPQPKETYESMYRQLNHDICIKRYLHDRKISPTCSNARLKATTSNCQIDRLIFYKK